MTALFDQLYRVTGYEKPIREGWWAEIWPMIFNFRIVVTDGQSVEAAWCYETRELAIAAFEQWDGTGEPKGWHKNPFTGERRIPGEELE